MKLLLSILFFLFTTAVCRGQIIIIDKVEVLNNNFKEALFYYHNNWEVARKIAIKEGYIKDYSLLINTDSTRKDNIFLITELENQTAYEQLESNFQKVFKSMNQEKPSLLNEKIPATFRKVTNVVLKEF